MYHSDFGLSNGHVELGERNPKQLLEHFHAVFPLLISINHYVSPLSASPSSSFPIKKQNENKQEKNMSGGVGKNVSDPGSNGCEVVLPYFCMLFCIVLSMKCVLTVQTFNVFREPR